MNEREIFAATLEQPTEAERQAFLNEISDSDLRKRIERLLKEQAQLGSFLNHPPLESDSDLLEGISPTMILSNSSTFENEREAISLRGTEMRDPAQDRDDKTVLSFLEPATREDAIGRLGHYEVIEVIGKGAFGTVLRAFDTKLERIVAIKILAPEMASMSPACKRFLREARTSAQIRHENVVTIHSVEEVPIPYLVMEYIPGRTLQQQLDEHGPLDLPSVLRLAKQIADGLAAAHAKELIHRDIKPGNILLEGDMEGRIKITDFGLARTVDDASITQSGIIAGTPMYMAPEQAHGQKLDQRADLFSFGSVLYQMLSGRPPFRAPTTIAVLKRVTEDTPRPIREIIPEVPEWMCELVGHLHAKDPAQRYSSAKEVSELLATCARELEAGRIPQIPDPVKADKESQKVTPAVTTNNRRRSRLQSPLVRTATVLLIMLGALGITEATGVTRLASTVIRLKSGTGTLVIETDDPGVKIAIDGDEVTITGGGVEELTLRPGEYNVAAMKDGKPIKQELVSITRNGRTVMRISQEGMNETVAGTGADSQPKRPHEGPAHAPPPAIAPFDNEQAEHLTESSPVQLFNGNDLTDWKSHPDGLGNWRVENGELVSSRMPSYLFSERDDFRDFELTCEVSISDGGDSGIIVRAPFQKVGPDGLPGYEAQIQSGKVLATGWATGAIAQSGGRTGWSLKQLSTLSIAPDEFFTLKIRAVRNRIETYVNDEKVAEYVDESRTYLHGHIALQHSGSGTIIKFRKVTLTELLP